MVALVGSVGRVREPGSSPARPSAHRPSLGCSAMVIKGEVGISYAKSGIESGQFTDHMSHYQDALAARARGRHWWSSAGWAGLEVEESSRYLASPASEAAAICRLQHQPGVRRR